MCGRWQILDNMLPLRHMGSHKGFVWLPLLLVILGVLVLGGGAYYVIRQNATPVIPIYQEATTEPTQTATQPTTQVATTVGPGTKIIATIDSSSLTSNSGSPVITGMFSGASLTDMSVFVVDGTQTLPKQYQGPGSINALADGPQQAYVNGQTTFPGSTLASGHYAVRLIKPEGGVLEPGTYTVGIYTESYLLISGTLTITSPGSQTSSVSISGMSRYTDSDFGFSFWYKTDSQHDISPTAQDYQATKYATLMYGTGTKVLKSINTSELNIDEVYSPGASILSDVDAGCCGSNENKYFFDASGHAWMRYTDGGSKGDLAGTTTADTTYNTMGGLHIFSGYTRFGIKEIIPLSAHNFLAIYSKCNDATSYTCSDEAKQRFFQSIETIMATDPKVATPRDAEYQTEKLHQLARALGVEQYYSTNFPADITLAIGHSVVGDRYDAESYVAVYLTALHAGTADVTVVESEITCVLCHLNIYRKSAYPMTLRLNEQNGTYPKLNLTLTGLYPDINSVEIVVKGN